MSLRMLLAVRACHSCQANTGTDAHLNDIVALRWPELRLQYHLQGFASCPHLCRRCVGSHLPNQRVRASRAWHAVGSAAMIILNPYLGYDRHAVNGTLP